MATVSEKMEILHEKLKHAENMGGEERIKNNMKKGNLQLVNAWHCYLTIIPL